MIPEELEFLMTSWRRRLFSTALFLISNILKNILLRLMKIGPETRIQNDINSF